MSNRVCKEEQIRLIMECRKSGLSDYQWCEKKGVHPGNFYNWVSKLRKEGYSFPESTTKSNALPNIQEVVKVDLLQQPERKSSQLIEHNVSHLSRNQSLNVAAELLIGNITLRLFNGADENLIQSLLKGIGGCNYAW